MTDWLKRNFWDGYTSFEKCFFPVLVLIQIIAYIIAPDSWLGMICGLSGVFCVVLTAKGKLISYAFNFLQISIYMYLVWNLGLYLEFYENIFYFITCIFGVFVWKKNMNKDTEQVIAKKLTIPQWICMIAGIVVGTVLLGYFGETILGNTLPYHDAATNVMAIVAQILLVTRYREQWAIWIAIDIICMIMFITLQQWSLLAMYIAWTANAVYGWINWTKLNKIAN